MERRFLLAILLSAGVVLGYFQFFAPKPKPKKANPATQGAPVEPGAAKPEPKPGDPKPGAPAPDPKPGDPPAPGPVASNRKQQAPHDEFTLKPADGEFLSVGFTTRGAAITEATLRNAFELAAGDVPKGETRWPLTLILPPYPDLLTGMCSFDDADAEGMRTTDWTIEEKTATSARFSFLTQNGLKVVKSISIPLDANRYDLEISLSVSRVEGAVAKGEKVTLRLTGVAGFAREPSNHTGMDTPTKAWVWVKGQQSEPEYGDYRVPEVILSAASRETKAFRLAVTMSHYFLAGLSSPGGKDAPAVRSTGVDGGDGRSRDINAAYDRLSLFFKERGRTPATDPVLVARMEEAALTFQRPWVDVDVGLAGSGAPQGEKASFQLYVGPLSRHVLGEDRYSGLSELITYPFAPDFVARFLLFIYDLCNSLTGSAGLAVILMTLVVRGGMMPLSIRNQLSMRQHGRKVAKLKPKLEQLKVRFANDPKRFREEQVKLFRKHGVGFPMGCLMLLLQMPIFFALFSSLRVEYSIRQQAFLWIHDLSGPDRLIDFGLAKPLLPFPPGGLWAFNLLPILYMALSIWQQRLMPQPADEQAAQQMKMAKWMSILFPILLYNYTAALALYMCVSSMVAIVEGRIVRAKDAHDLAKAAAPADDDEDEEE